MSLPLFSSRDAHLVQVCDRLRLAFGPLLPFRRRDPVSQLVRSMIGSRTYDAVSETVFAALRARFSPWGRLADARLEEVLPLVAPVTYPEDKAQRLIAGLRLVRKRAGTLQLHFLERWPLDEAMAWLLELPGVGQKVAASVLNFSTLDRRVFVVDGHILRVCARLGLCEGDGDADACREAVMEAAPADWTGQAFVDLHRLMKTLGQTVCRFGRPECFACPVGDLCPTADPSGRGVAARVETDASQPTPVPANENKPATDRLDAYLRRRITRLERQGVPAATLLEAGVSLGAAELDAVFVGARFPAGAHQSAGAGMEDGACALAPALAVASGLALAAPSHRRGGSAPRLLCVQEGDVRREQGDMYAPGLEALGLCVASTAFARARDGPEALAVADEALRRRAAPLVVVELRRSERLADLSVVRRFNLQARRAGLFLFFVTPDLQGASAAATRWRVTSAASQAPRRRMGPPTFRLDLVRNRAGRTGSWLVEWSAHERRILSARVLPSGLGGDGRAPLPASVDSTAFHRSGAA